MNKKIIFIVLILILITGIYYFLVEKKETTENKIVCIQDVKECPDGIFVSRIPPDCNFASCRGEKEGILVSSPKINKKIKSPLKILGEARGFWFFEAQFTAEIYDENENFLGQVILAAKDDWMKEDFVPFEGELEFSQPETKNGKLKFLSANPSGLPEHQKIFEIPVQFEIETAFLRRVLLYYYNPDRDKDENGNIKCSRDGLVAIERKIPISKTPIQDTIKLLLKGKENLTDEDFSQGITTEYSLEGFKLKSANLKGDGTLILEFEDPLNKTIGGSCRIGILWFQIEETAKQFPEVKKVQFFPEELFQP